MDRTRIRKRMSVRRRSIPPVEEAPRTWSEVVFFPFSKVALALMAAMLLIYLCSAWLFQPEEEVHEMHIEPAASPFAPPAEMGPDFRRPAQVAPLEPPRPSGGIVIEK